MNKYARRILFSNLGGWWPAIATVTVVTALVGLCTTQFAWTRDERFVTEVQAQGHAITEFTIVAETIYLLVAALAVFSLTVVGTATVDSTRRTFAQWRLVGATPSDVRRGIWALVATAACLGALPGSLIAIAASYPVIPVFNQLAAPGFDTPVLPPSPLAWITSLVLGVATCMLGAFGPARRASTARPIEVFRALPVHRRRRWWWRVPLAVLALLCSVGMLAVAIVSADPAAGVAVMFNLALNAGMWAVLFIYLIGPLAIPGILAGLGRLARGSATGRLAAKAAVERVHASANTIAPLAAGIGGAGAILVSVESSAAVIRTFDDSAEANLSDTLVMTALASLILLTTSAAVVALAARDREREHSLLRIAGMSSRDITTWHVYQSFFLAVTATVLALAPVAVTTATTAAASAAYTGHPIIVVPKTALAVGFILSWSVLFLVQWSPARRLLRADIAVGLRAT